jgi:diaminopimelate decarboxylase
MSDLRARCEGVVPLRGRLEPWHVEVAEDPDRVAGWIEEHGSPVNFIDPAPMERNAAELTSAATDRGVALRTFFARKANKALSLVDEAKRLGLGVDVASENELRQVLDRGLPREDIIVTAAVKPRALLELCAERGVTVAIDNRDELDVFEDVARASGRSPHAAVRLAPSCAQTRFGMAATEIGDIDPSTLEITGVHFHLDGYDAGERVAAIGESLGLIDTLRERGHEPAFLDIGGGIPMSYLESRTDWGRFWNEHARSIAGERAEITIDRHEIGTVYPYSQSPVRGEWLRGVLDASLDAGTVADGLRTRDIELRMEPGRSLLDGCGMTAARVEFRKQRANGAWFIGVAMNRTQMRSTSDDFMVDPLVVRPASAGEPTEAIEGYLVGAYCIEREFLSWRRFSFPGGIAVGDVVAFPNTAGYLMHILESASHQIPLARNLLVRDGEAELDAIDTKFIRGA